MNHTDAHPTPDTPPMGNTSGQCPSMSPTADHASDCCQLSMLVFAAQCSFMKDVALRASQRLESVAAVLSGDLQHRTELLEAGDTCGGFFARHERAEEVYTADAFVSTDSAIEASRRMSEQRDEILRLWLPLKSHYLDAPQAPPRNKRKTSVLCFEIPAFSAARRDVDPPTPHTDTGHWSIQRLSNLPSATPGLARKIAQFQQAVAAEEEASRKRREALRHSAVGQGGTAGGSGVGGEEITRMSGVKGMIRMFEMRTPPNSAMKHRKPLSTPLPIPRAMTCIMNPGAGDCSPDPLQCPKVAETIPTVDVEDPEAEEEEVSRWDMSDRSNSEELEPTPLPVRKSEDGRRSWKGATSPIGSLLAFDPMQESVAAPCAPEGRCSPSIGLEVLISNSRGVSPSRPPTLELAHEPAFVSPSYIEEEEEIEFDFLGDAMELAPTLAAVGDFMRDEEGDARFRDEEGDARFRDAGFRDESCNEDDGVMKISVENSPRLAMSDDERSPSKMSHTSGRSEGNAKATETSPAGGTLGSAFQRVGGASPQADVEMGQIPFEFVEADVPTLAIPRGDGPQMLPSLETHDDMSDFTPDKAFVTPRKEPPAILSENTNDPPAAAAVAPLAGIDPSTSPSEDEDDSYYHQSPSAPPLQHDGEEDDSMDAEADEADVPSEGHAVKSEESTPKDRKLPWRVKALSPMRRGGTPGVTRSAPRPRLPSGSQSAAVVSDKRQKWETREKNAAARLQNSKKRLLHVQEEKRQIADLKQRIVQERKHLLEEEDVRRRKEKLRQKQLRPEKGPAPSVLLPALGSSNNRGAGGHPPAAEGHPLEAGGHPPVDAGGHPPDVPSRPKMETSDPQEEASVPRCIRPPSAARIRESSPRVPRLPLQCLNPSPAAPEETPTVKSEPKSSTPAEDKENTGAAVRSRTPRKVQRMHRRLKSIPPKNPNDSITISDEDEDSVPYQVNMRVAAWARSSREWKSLVFKNEGIDPQSIFGCGARPPNFEEIFHTPDFHRAAEEISRKDPRRCVELVSEESRTWMQKRWQQDKDQCGIRPNEGVNIETLHQFRAKTQKSQDVSHLVWEPSWLACGEACQHSSIVRQPWFKKLEEPGSAVRGDSAVRALDIYTASRQRRAPASPGDSEPPIEETLKLPQGLFRGLWTTAAVQSPAAATTTTPSKTEQAARSLVRKLTGTPKVLPPKI